MNYIKVNSGIQFAKVVRVDGREKVAFGTAENAPHTLYLDADRAKALAFKLLEAAKHASAEIERSQREFMKAVEASHVQMP